MKITYVIQKSRRRSISVSVMTDNLVLVKAPYGTTERMVQEFLLSKKDWITKHLKKQNMEEEKAESLGLLSADEIKQINGNLNFNCLLVIMPPEIMDSVVVHELCHRRHMNHSKEFYAEIDRVFPDYKRCNKWLKDNGGVYLKRVSLVGTTVR